MSNERTPANPETIEQWQEAVDMADLFLAIDAAVQYGLVKGGPAIDAARCEEILREGKQRGIVPNPDLYKGWF